ncbi:hypothetical protein QM574_08460 [Pantoea ananatis]|uniref:hypothetical protein n=1 Tax=Pantoea ananas TaxID=553 RepID=UPI0024B71425|nr:hypothetical protein [Pantoea ananatis]MDJ0044592.1 hypothetical protein [Pantoea ananatis]
MVATVPDEFIAAFDRMWRLPADMDHSAVFNSQEFLHFREMADKHCYAQIKGNLLDPFLLQGLRKLGLTCFFTAGSPLAATGMSETAALCHEALMRCLEQHTYLCPLDCAGDIPQIETAGLCIRRFSKQELDGMLNSLPLQRLPGYASADTAGLSQFLWLEVGDNKALSSDFSERYWKWNTSRDKPGTVYPYQTHHPEAVEKAVFLLMLIAWEECNLSEDCQWRPFRIPWVHTLSDDIFGPQKPVPSAASLTWIPRAYCDEEGVWHESEEPHSYGHSLSREQMVPVIDADVCKHLETAVSRGFINAAARHQFVKAFMSDGVDELLAHIVVIDACVGGKSENKSLEGPLKKLGATAQLKYRLAGLLSDASAWEVMHVLYKARNNYVHGDTLEKIPGEHILQARSLARRTLNAIITEAGRTPSLTREAFLDQLLRRGWDLLKGRCQ